MLPEQVVQKQLEYYNKHDKENIITKAVAIYEVKDDLIQNVWFVTE